MAAMPLSAQQWVDRTERPILGTAFCAHGGFDDAPVRCRDRSLLTFDGQVWEPTHELPAGTDGVVDLAFDRQRGVVVGLLTSGAGPAQTWTFDGRAWRHRGGGPLAGAQPSVAFVGLVGDPSAIGGGRVLALHDDVQAQSTADCYFDGATWLPLAAQRPFGLHLVAADLERQELVGLGLATTASVAPTMAGHTYVWNGIAWSQRITTSAPPARRRGVLGFDTATRCVLLFGSVDAAGQPLADTWLWNGETWSQVTTAHAPPGHAGHLASDRWRGRTILFDTTTGSTNDWEWTGADWRALAYSPGATPASAIRYSGDPLRRRLVRAQSDGTFEWDGVVWSRRADARLSDRMTPMAYDLVARSWVVFGGENPLLAGGPPVFADTWTFDGAAWSQVAASGPTGRRDHALVSHLDANGVVLFGGIDASGARCGDTWLFSQGTWTELTLSLIGPSPKAGAASGAADAFGLRNFVVAGPGLWSLQWNRSHLPCWQPWDDGVPGFDLGSPFAMSNRVLGIDPVTGDPVLAVRNGPVSAVHRFHATVPMQGTWSRLGDLPAAVDGMAVDPLRNRLLLFAKGDTYVHASPAAAEVQIGRGCGAPAPEIRGEGIPRLGSPDYRIAALSRPGAPLLLGLDLARGLLPLGNGCTVYLGGLWLTQAAVADARGFCAFGSPVPDDPVLRGLEVHAQIAELGVHPPIALSAALRITIGD